MLPWARQGTVDTPRGTAGGPHIPGTFGMICDYGEWSMKRWQVWRVSTGRVRAASLFDRQYEVGMRAGGKRKHVISLAFATVVRTRGAEWAQVVMLYLTSFSSTEGNTNCQVDLRRESSLRGSTSS